jgi:hypothetical protein
MYIISKIHIYVEITMKNPKFVVENEQIFVLVAHTKINVIMT